MTPTIKIKVGAQCWDCDLCISGKCSKNVSEFRGGIMVPGPACPGPGVRELCPQGTAAELDSAKDEIGFIKQICDNYAEFGRPMDPEANLPDLAERVYGTVCDLVMELDKAKAELERLKAERIGKRLIDEAKIETMHHRLHRYAYEDCGNDVIVMRDVIEFLNATGLGRKAGTK